MEKRVEIPGLLNEHGMKTFLCAVIPSEPGKCGAQAEEILRVVAGFLYERIHCGERGLALTSPVKCFGAQQADRWFGTVHARQIRQRFLSLFLIRRQTRQL